MGEVVPFAERRRAKRRAMVNLRAPAVWLDEGTVAGLLSILDRPVPKLVDAPAPKPVRVTTPKPTVLTNGPAPELEVVVGSPPPLSAPTKPALRVLARHHIDAACDLFDSGSLSAAQIKTLTRRAFAHLRRRGKAVRYFNTDVKRPLFTLGGVSRELTPVELVAHAFAEGMEAADAEG